MRTTLSWFLVLILLIIVQTTIFSFPIFFPLLLALYVNLPPKDGFWLAFGSGAALDLFAGTALGRSSLALLLVAGLVNAYKRRYFSTHPAYTFSLTFVGFLVFDFITRAKLSLAGAVFASLLSLPAILLVNRFSKEKEELKI